MFTLGVERENTSCRVEIFCHERKKFLTSIFFSQKNFHSSLRSELETVFFREKNCRPKFFPLQAKYFHPTGIYSLLYIWTSLLVSAMDRDSAKKTRACHALSIIANRHTQAASPLLPQWRRRNAWGEQNFSKLVRENARPQFWQFVIIFGLLPSTPAENNNSWGAIHTL